MQLIILTATVSVILLATLRPFNFRFEREFTSERIPVIDWEPLPTREHEGMFVDTALNILLFIPYGMAFYPRRRSTAGIPMAILSATVSATFLSSFCEVAQVWLPTRHPEFRDVVTNTLGAFAGATAAAVWERIVFLAPAREIRSHIRWNRASVALLVFLALPLVHSVIHLDPVRSVEELEEHAKAFIHAPVFDLWSAENTALPFLFLGALSFSAAEWAMASLPPLRTPFTYIPVFLLSSLYAVLLPIPRIFFRSFNPNWGSILFGVLGISAGIALHRWFRYPLWGLMGERNRFPSPQSR